MYSISVCLLLMPGRNIHYYIKVTIREDRRVVTLREAGESASQLAIRSNN